MFESAFFLIFFQTEPCNFDELNKQSPCHFPTCYEDAESAECIRYILDYCNQWEDRGCVIELPQLLNKVVDCKTVRIFAYSSTREHSNKRSGMRLKTESETGEGR